MERYENNKNKKLNSKNKINTNNSNNNDKKIEKNNQAETTKVTDNKEQINLINNEDYHSDEDPDVWLEKRMAALLADYEAGEKRHEKVPLDEETRKTFDARTISIEISLLFRGFQTIGNFFSYILFYLILFIFINFYNR